MITGINSTTETIGKLICELCYVREGIRRSATGWCGEHRLYTCAEHACSCEERQAVEDDFPDPDPGDVAVS